MMLIDRFMQLTNRFKPLINRKNHQIYVFPRIPPGFSWILSDLLTQYEVPWEKGRGICPDKSRHCSNMLACLPKKLVDVLVGHFWNVVWAPFERMWFCLEKSGESGQQYVLSLFCHFEVIFKINTMKRIAGKLHRIILLQFELRTFQFYYGRTRKPRFAWFLHVWDPWESLLMDLNIPNYF